MLEIMRVNQDTCVVTDHGLFRLVFKTKDFLTIFQELSSLGYTVRQMKFRGRELWWYAIWNHLSYGEPLPPPPPPAPREVWV